MKTDAERLTELLSDQYWRLNNLYYIRTADGSAVKFKMNFAQEDFYKNLHYFNVILKSRQLGFSTFILIYMLDACLFNSNHQCGVIAQGLTEATDLFDNKVKFAYDRLPDWLKAERGLVSDNSRKLTFTNGSSIVVGTSLRGGTFQKLHVSEYGKISAKYPDKAKEIKTGAFNTVHAGQMIFVESTAEGQGGEFYDLVKVAQNLADTRAKLTALDPKFHFYPWWVHPDYRLSDNETLATTIVKERADYFEGLEQAGIRLTDNQKAWYVKKADLMGDDMLREYPSTPEESFAASMEGSIYGKQMTQIRRAGQICRVPHEPRDLVHTFWDLGNYDYTAVWFFQHVGREYRMIRYLQASGQDLTHYASELRKFGYNYGRHYLPHDGARSQLGLKNQSVKQILEGLGVTPITIVPRSNDVRQDIETQCKTVLPKVWFDSVNCADGITCLDNYRKQWDDRLGVWRDEPRHDEYSHGADAFRTFAMGYQEPVKRKKSASGGQDSWMDF